MDSRELERALHRLLAPVLRGIRLLASRITLTAAVDRAPVQAVQFEGLEGEVKDGVEYLQAFGFSSVPLPGARGLAVFAAADRSHGVVVVLDDRKRQPLTLGPGETLLWDALGQFLHFRSDGTALLKTDTLRIEAAALEVTGEIKDRCDSDGRSMRGMRAVYNAHVHAEHDAGGPTAPPAEEM